MKEDLKMLIKLYKGMLIAYEEMIKEGIDEGVLLSKKGTLEMVIEDLEGLVDEYD